MRELLRTKTSNYTFVTIQIQKQKIMILLIRVYRISLRFVCNFAFVSKVKAPEKRCICSRRYSIISLTWLSSVCDLKTQSRSWLSAAAAGLREFPSAPAQIDIASAGGENSIRLTCTIHDVLKRDDKLMRSEVFLRAHIPRPFRPIGTRIKGAEGKPPKVSSFWWKLAGNIPVQKTCNMWFFKI